MPIFRNIAVKIDSRRIIKRLGHRKGMEIHDNLDKLIRELIDEANVLIEPTLALKTLNLIRYCDDGLCFEQNLHIDSPRISKFLQNVKKLSVYCATIGNELEKRVEGLSGSEALILDTIGSEATEQIARWMNQNLKIQALKVGYHLTKRRSPGYMDFDLSIQKQLLKISGGDSLGIQVNQSNFLYPRKSTTGIIGWVRNGRL